MKRAIWAIMAVIFISACVPAKKYEEAKQKRKLCEEELIAIKEQNRRLDENFKELQQKNAKLNKRLEALKEDTSMLGNSLRMVSKNYDKLNNTYEILLNRNEELLKGNQRETKKLFENLKTSQMELRKQSDSLEMARAILQEKQDKLIKLQEELNARAKRVDELESILNKKDSVVNALKSKVQNALLGFENNGLTIEERNGKVYVSLDESLLFKSGSYQVDSKGKTVLRKLGGVLEKNQDVNVLVEGHTDNVPYNGKGQLSDNWDLSVRRATAVVKIILDGSKLDPERLTAAGRGEHFPIASNDTASGRSKNRRTEIILTPKLDELFEILNTN
jgi:chemotaxis protein MotB